MDWKVGESAGLPDWCRSCWRSALNGFCRADRTHWVHIHDGPDAGIEIPDRARRRRPVHTACASMVFECVCTTSSGVSLFWHGMQLNVMLHLLHWNSTDIGFIPSLWNMRHTALGRRQAAGPSLKSGVDAGSFRLRILNSTVTTSRPTRSQRQYYVLLCLACVFRMRTRVRSVESETSNCLFLVRIVAQWHDAIYRLS